MFNEHFVKPGKVSVEAGKFYASMFDFRQKGDYGDFIDFETEKVKSWLEEAKKHIQELEKFLEQEVNQ